jgi:hypothetical protein
VRDVLSIMPNWVGELVEKVNSSAAVGSDGPQARRQLSSRMFASIYGARLVYEKARRRRYGGGGSESMCAAIYLLSVQTA